MVCPADVKADGVVYQSGMAAIESDPELDVEVQADALAPTGRRGAPAEHTAGPRLLATYQLPRRPAPNRPRRGPQLQLRPDAGDRPAGQLDDLALGGRHEPDAGRLPIRTKAPYLEVDCRARRRLWSAVLDGTPLKPQKRERDSA